MPLAKAYFAMTPPSAKSVAAPSAKAYPSQGA